MAKKRTPRRTPSRAARAAPTPTAVARSAGSARTPMLITFKPKEARPDKTDKVEIVKDVLSARVEIFSAADFTAATGGVPTGLEPEEVGFDINLYEAPIVAVSLTNSEISALRNNPNVSMVEEDGLCYALPDSLVFEGQPSPAAETVPVGVQQVKAPLAWGCSRGRGIKVAVLDTGVDWTHPDLAPNFKGAVSFVPGETAMDGHSHGTHCAGTIAAAINGAGVVGVAPEAWLYAVKVLANNGSGNWSWLISGLNWCVQNKIQIASMSLGGGGAPAALETMCNAAFNAGVLLVAAAGNSGPAMNTVGQPAKYKNVIAVSAIDSANVIANFSSRGPEIELSAPGVQVLSTVPGGGFGTKSGTSMACPHVAGGAAVVWGSHRFATNVQIWNLLASAADNLGPPGWDPLYGYGRLDVDQAALAMVPAPAVPLKP
jgi:subtilisin